MTIEEKIDLILFKWVQSARRLVFPIIKWTWQGSPGEGYPFHRAVNNAIKEGDKTECLTSSSLYVRECKKYFMEKE